MGSTDTGHPPDLNSSIGKSDHDQIATIGPGSAGGGSHPGELVSVYRGDLVDLAPTCPDLYGNRLGPVMAEQVDLAAGHPGHSPMC